MLNLKQFLQSKVLRIIFLSYVFLIISFGRSFVGLSIFNFRIGEITIAISFVCLILFIIHMIFNLKDFSKIHKKLLLYISSLILTFIISIIFYDVSFFNLYIYRVSSYIWSIGSLVLFTFWFKENNFSKKFIYLLNLLLIWVYYFSIYGINDNLQNIILNYSDKFEYPKGSDVLMFFVFVSFFSNRIFINSKLRLEIFIFKAALYLPLLAIKSRSAFVAFVIFLILEIYSNKQLLKINIRNILVITLTILIFLQSTFLVTKSGILKPDSISENIQFVSSYRSQEQNPGSTDNETRFIYFSKKRLYSADGNFNWRLQIWQDVFTDLKSSGKLLFGYGYFKKIPAMDDPLRSGNDGTNENVHNFLINVLARGGFLHLIFYCLFLINLYKLIPVKNKYGFLSIVIPLLFTSLFDASMENAHYPILFYLLVGFQLNTRKQ